MDWNFENFSEKEFACKCCGEAPMDEAFVSALQDLRTSYNRPLTISSGYRCPAHNQAVSSTGAAGPHTTGKAADVVIAGADAIELLKLALDRFNGIGVNQRGAWEKRFIHLDLIEGSNRPAIWTY